MANGPSEHIEFDILIQASGSGGVPHVTTIESFQPASETIEKCHRWLAARGVTCHPTHFGLSCSAPRGLFESLFSTQLEPTEGGPGKPEWQSDKEPQPPSEIAKDIYQITISAPPELF